MEKINKTIVLVADRIKNHNNSTEVSKTLEQVEDSYYYPLKEALDNIAEDVKIYNSIDQFEKDISNLSNAIVFNIYSGFGFRNGKALIPALCEINHLAYWGGDVYTHIICADKHLSKLYSSEFGFNCPNGFKITSKNLQSDLFDYLTYPIVIKPNSEGGSIGISRKNLVSNKEAAYKLAKDMLLTFPVLIAEEYINGQELNILMVGNKHEVAFCEVYRMEINGIFDFNNYIYGYEDKKKNQDHTIERYQCVTHEIPSKIIENAKKLFLSFEKVNVLRIDGRYLNNNFYVLELSPDVYIGNDSNFTNMFHEKGYSFEEMLIFMLKNI